MMGVQDYTRLHKILRMMGVQDSRFFQDSSRFSPSQILQAKIPPKDPHRMMGGPFLMGVLFYLFYIQDSLVGAGYIWDPSGRPKSSIETADGVVRRCGNLGAVIRL